GALLSVYVDLRGPPGAVRSGQARAPAVAALDHAAGCALRGEELADALRAVHAHRGTASGHATLSPIRADRWRKRRRRVARADRASPGRRGDDRLPGAPAAARGAANRHRPLGAPGGLVERRLGRRARSALSPDPLDLRQPQERVLGAATARRRIARLVTEVLAPAPTAAVLIWLVAWRSAPIQADAFRWAPL